MSSSPKASPLKINKTLENYSRRNSFFADKSVDPQLSGQMDVRIRMDGQRFLIQERCQMLIMGMIVFEEGVHFIRYLV
jgi:hypothetical protein